MYNPVKPYKQEILQRIQETWKTPYVRVRPGLYPIIEKKFDAPEVQHSDGIGTKGLYHLRHRSYKEAVQDAFAMNANDLAMVGAIPYALQDHIVTPEEDEKGILLILRALTQLAIKHRIAITGGETSHHNNVDALDIGISMSGFLKKERTNRFVPGDTLVGLASNGLHSNGFTLVRGMFGADEWRDDFVRPTAIYLDIVHAILKKHEVHGMMHITGGAFAKLKDVLTNADAFIEFPTRFTVRPIFHEIYARGVSSERMYTTLNCGIGYVLSMPEKAAKVVLRSMRSAYRIGRVEKGTGVVSIRSVFDDSTVTL